MIDLRDECAKLCCTGQLGWLPKNDAIFLSFFFFLLVLISCARRQKANKMCIDIYTTDECFASKWDCVASCPHQIAMTSSINKLHMFAAQSYWTKCLAKGLFGRWQQTCTRLDSLVLFFITQMMKLMNEWMKSY